MVINRIYCLLRPCLIRLTIILCFLLFLINSYAQNSGPVAHYPFNGNANDESGNGNNGTEHGGVLLTADRFGNDNSAYSFDGVDDYIQIPNSESFNIENQITISYWVKLETSAPYYYPYHIVEKGGSWGSGQRAWDINFAIGFDDTTYSVWCTDFESERYYNVTMTYDGITAAIYKNGNKIDSVRCTGLIPTSTADIFIGEYAFGGNYYFDGIIDDVRIYNRALNESEIDSLYHEGGWNTDLVAYYPFNGNANDESGNGNHGTEHGGVLLTADRFGNDNSAYSFDGMDDYIEIIDNGFSKGDSFSLSLWININGINASNNNNNLVICKEVSSNDTEFRLNFSTNQDEPYRLHFEANSIGANPSVSVYNLNRYQWHHLLLTYGNNKMRCYLNSVLNDSVENQNPIIEGDMPIYIGSGTFNNSMLDYYFHGAIDDIYIYNSVLEENEIDSLYHEGGWDLDTTPPGTPQNLTATPGNQQVTLCWDANTESDLHKYNIYRDTSSPATTLIDSVLGAPPDTFYVDDGLTNGQIYYYRITAVDSAGNESGYSVEVSVKPNPVVINVPNDYTTIQTGINAASNGDTVLVQPGIYTENLFWPETNGIKLISAGDSSNTIINGGDVSSVIYMNPLTATIDTTTLIQGFKITNGGNVQNGGGILLIGASPKMKSVIIVNNNANVSGGGMYLNDFSNPKMINVTISSNSSSSHGGGMYLRGVSIPTMINVTISDNNGWSGGGLFLSNSSNALMTNVTISNNSGINGGGMFLTNTSNPVMTNVRVTGNNAGPGGGIFLDQSSPLMNNVTISNNSGTNGGGIYFTTSSNPTMTDVTIDNNTATSGGGIYVSGYNDPTMDSVTIYGNVASNGGGIYFHSANGLTIDNVTISGNNASSGGGILLAISDLTINNVTISDNKASSGGGVYVTDASSLTMAVVTISGNSASSGGGIYLNDNTQALTITQLTLVNNLALNLAGGIYIGAGNPTISNCNFILNGQSINNTDNSNITQALNNYWGHTSGPYHPSQNPTGQGDSTNVFVNVTPWLTAPNTDAPISPPQNVNKEQIGNDIKLSWTANSESDLIGYKLYYGSPTGYSYTNNIDVGNVMTFTITTGVSINDTIAITAYDSDADDNNDQFEGHESWFSIALELDNNPPNIPQNITATPGNRQVTLRWSPNTESDLHKYNIYRGTSSPATNLIDSCVASSPPDTFYIDDGLTNGQIYYYRITAVDNDGNESDYSEEVSGTPYYSVPFTKITTGPIVEEITNIKNSAWGDYNNDGYIDLFVGADNNMTNFLYQNNGDATFTAFNFDSYDLTRSVSWCDYNIDGYIDLFIGNTGESSYLFKNSGPPDYSLDELIFTFDAINLSAATWGDYNNDGFPDLVIAVDGGLNKLFKNEGDGNFTSVSTPKIELNSDNSFDCGWADIDRDNDLDLFIPGGGSVENDVLYRNNGDNTFSKIIDDPLITDESNYHGESHFTFGDYDNDGDLDIYRTTRNNGNQLYNNDGNGNFTNSTSILNPVPSLTLGWGTHWIDVDNDGDLDLFIATPSNTTNKLYINDNGEFTLLQTGEIVNESNDSFTGTWCDYDNDGDLDLVVSNYLEKSSFYRNDINSGNYLKVKVVGLSGTNIGAKVEIIHGSNRQLRYIYNNSGYSGQNSPIAHFGLGEITNVDSVKVRLTTGVNWYATNVSANQQITMAEPNPGIWYVMKSGSDEFGSGFFNSPCASIQHGIDQASDGDTVLVHPGTYVENINFNGKNIVVGSLFLTTQDTSYISLTIIDGNQQNGISVVLFESGETNNAKLSGFTITGGTGTYRAGDFQFAEGIGGGIMCYQSSPTLSNLMITNNSSPETGGGICLWNSDAIIERSIIKNNVCDWSGGGIYVNNSSPQIINCLVINNNAISENMPSDTQGGGGIYISGSESDTTVLINCTVANNQTGGEGGGLYANNSSFKIINSIVWQNTAIENGVFENPNISALPLGDIKSSYSLIEGGRAGIGNIDTDPLFIDATIGNYRLTDYSPCIGAGLDTNIVSITDLDDNPCPNPAGSNPDMGAYENSLSAPLHNSFIHVDTTGNDSASVGLESAPFATIQASIDYSNDGDTVLVHPGTYVENINFNGKNIVVGSLFLTTQDTSYISSTIIDGNQDTSVVIFNNGETADAVLCGVTLQNGSAYQGGGVYSYHSSPTLKNLRIIGNYAVHGGGMLCSRSSSEIINVILTGNSANWDGGGLFCLNGSNVIISNTVINGNSSTGLGAGIYSTHSIITLINVTITDNVTSHGGGIYSTYDGNTVLVNCIVWGNTPEQIYFRDVDAPSVLTVSYSNIQGGQDSIVTNDNGTVNWGVGNIDTDPLFVDATNNDYHLSYYSPCIGTGTNSLQIDGAWHYAPSTDLDGNPRPNPAGSRPDMGAYENSRATPIDTVPPAIPQNLVITDYLQAIILKWNASVNADMSHYNIYRANSPDFSTDSTYFMGKVFAPDTTYIDSLIQNNNTYYYQVTAVDTTGNESDPSDEIVVTATVVDIRDIAFKQRIDGSGLVNIYYSFSGHDTTHYEVIPYLSNFNDEEWGKLSQVSGDAGAVLPGDSRQITWNLKSEAPEMYSNNSTIKITIGLPSKGNQYNPLNEAKIQIEGRIER